MTPSEPHKYSQQEIEATRETQAYLDKTDHEIERLEGELRKAWDYYGGLSDSTGRIEVPAEDLEAQIAALTERRRALDKMAGRFREDVHDQVDQVLAFHVERLNALLASPLGAGEIQELELRRTEQQARQAEKARKAAEQQLAAVET